MMKSEKQIRRQIKNLNRYRHQQPPTRFRRKMEALIAVYVLHWVLSRSWETPLQFIKS